MIVLKVVSIVVAVTVLLSFLALIIAAIGNDIILRDKKWQ